MRSRYYLKCYEHVADDFIDTYCTEYNSSIDDIYLAFSRRDLICSVISRRFLIEHKDWKSLIISNLEERRTYAA